MNLTVKLILELSRTSISIDETYEEPEKLMRLLEIKIYWFNISSMLYASPCGNLSFHTVVVRIIWNYVTFLAGV